MDIHKTSLPTAELKVGNGTVGTSAVKLTGIGYVGLRRGLSVATPSDNSNNVYVGRSNVSASNGYLLKPGMAHTFEVESTDELYIIGGASGQVYSWSAI